MKKLIVAILVSCAVFCVFPAFAADSTADIKVVVKDNGTWSQQPFTTMAVNTEDGRTVMLKNDGTWTLVTRKPATIKAHHSGHVSKTIVTLTYYVNGNAVTQKEKVIAGETDSFTIPANADTKSDSYRYDIKCWINYVGKGGWEKEYKDQSIQPGQTVKWEAYVGATSDKNSFKAE
jgi:hypothetical protein